jgi:hypothetical protein
MLMAINNPVLRGTYRWSALVLVLAVALAGCSTTETSTVTGALIGAGLGAVIGHQSGHAVEGALIGVVVGGAAGYVVGRTRTERLASAERTATAQNYRAVEGLQVKVSDAAVAPNLASPGEDIDLNATLALMAPSTSQAITVRQRVALYKGNELVGNIVEDNFTLTPGTHRLTRRITLQKSFPSGRYTYVTHVKAISGNDIAEGSSETSFTVG